jgi:hypothetical protein
MSNNNYRVQHKDGNRWYSLKLEDISLRSADDAKRMAEHFRSYHGGEYRAQERGFVGLTHDGRGLVGWVTLPRLGKPE